VYAQLVIQIGVVGFGIHLMIEQFQNQDLYNVAKTKYNIE
jgi:hypothetical protein